MTSPTTPQGMVRFGLFKRQLHALLDNALTEVDILRTTSTDPVTIDRAWILDKLNHQMKQEGYVIKPKTTQVVQGLGTLLTLPRELRDMIYGHAVTNGTVALARASRQVRREFCPMLFKHGIYRIDMGVARNGLCHPYLTRLETRKIQHVHVRVDVRGTADRPFDCGLRQLHRFDGTKVRRGTCAVVFELDPYVHLWAVHKIIHSLAHLAGFERVVVEFQMRWLPDPWCRDPEPGEGEDRWMENPLYREYEHLEWTLGPAELVNTEAQILQSGRDAYRATFYPRKADESTEWVEYEGFFGAGSSGSA